MKITEFAVYVAEREGGKKQVNIAQIMELLKVINGMLAGKLYRLIRAL